MVVLGDGPLRASLNERIRVLGLKGKLFLLGALPHSQVADWLSASDLFVLPSRYEGGPATALMEAMACGCAVVACDVSGTSELITDETIGRLVPTQNPPALGAAISELLSNRELRSTLAARAREKVLAEFTIEACMRKTETVLDATVVGRKLPAPLKPKIRRSRR
jgi:glycosyltransferase involved in cell wall biosynthesis